MLSYYLSGLKPSKVQSFGSIGHFKQSKKPAEAGDAKRCHECAYANDCVWEAKKIYVDPLSQVEDSQRVSIGSVRSTPFILSLCSGAAFPVFLPQVRPDRYSSREADTRSGLSTCSTPTSWISKM